MPKQKILDPASPDSESGDALIPEYESRPLLWLVFLLVVTGEKTKEGFFSWVSGFIRDLR